MILFCVARLLNPSIPHANPQRFSKQPLPSAPYPLESCDICMYPYKTMIDLKRNFSDFFLSYSEWAVLGDVASHLVCVTFVRSDVRFLSCFYTSSHGCGGPCDSIGHEVVGQLFLRWRQRVSTYLSLRQLS